jgi:hypothetical protein
LFENDNTLALEVFGKSDNKWLLPAREDIKVGCQMFRKTGYLLAIFGDDNNIELKQSARHSTDQNSGKYRKDAADFYVHNA